MQAPWSVKVTNMRIGLVSGWNAAAETGLGSVMREGCYNLSTSAIASGPCPHEAC